MFLLLKNGRAFTPNNSYGGPLTNNFSFDKFKEELKQLGATSYKIRFSPWLGNYKYFPNARCNRKTVARDLTQPVKFGHGTEWSIKKSYKQGLKVIKINQNYTRFWLLYDSTMKRVKAENCYFYDNLYFYKLAIALDGNIDLWIAQDDTFTWMAAAIFLFDKENVHYYLSGMDCTNKKLYPMECIINETCYYYKSQDKKLIHFGGGLHEGDSLFNFKKKFGNMELDYYIAEETI